MTRPRNLGSTPAPSQERVARHARAVSRARLLLSSLSLSPYIYIYIYRERDMYICMQLLHITFIITSSIFIYNHHIYTASCLLSISSPGRLPCGGHPIPLRAHPRERQRGRDSERGWHGSPGWDACLSSIQGVQLWYRLLAGILIFTLARSLGAHTGVATLALLSLGLHAMKPSCHSRATEALRVRF